MTTAQAPSMEAFDAYFRRADLDRDGRISGAEAVAFFQGSNLPKHVLAQIWMHADQKRTGYLGRPEFYNALRLVTVAQSGRELSPDIVKAALYGPAAAKIPAPQINPVSPAVSQLNSANNPPPPSNTMASPSSQIVVTGGLNASQNFGFRGPQTLPNADGNHFMRPPQTAPAASLPMQGVSQGLPGGGSVAGPRLPSSNAPSLSTDWFGTRTNAASGGVTSVPIRGPAPFATQDGFGLAQLGTAPGLTPRPQVQPAPTASILSNQSLSQPAANDSKSLVLTSGNGFSSDSVLGGDVFSATPQAKQDASKSTFPPSNIPSSSGIASVSTSSQNSIKPGQPDLMQSMSTRSPTGSQLQGTQSLVKQNQLDTVQSTSALAVSNVSAGLVSSASSQSQLSWPKMTQSDIQKYAAVFVAVDKDRDGKITGLEARNLFLSWKLPREVLKQVWDLSDQDNDSMLSLREFCTALYLMERYREGHPLPAVLPNSLRIDETLLPATSQPSTAYAGPAWQPRPGLSQQAIPGSQHVTPPTGAKPPVQIPKPSQPVQHKSQVPVLEKHLVNQLSKEEQSALNSKFQEAADADKKVQELEKEILDSRGKLGFYHTKMQELVLYKSKCDNRLNEIVERTSADKREVESLEKKYETKYKQVGDVASKLTMDEATFRDIQEKKLELFNAIVKMEKGGGGDDKLQVRADTIQSDIDELVKDLNERCKQYGLRAKPITLVELPFGWQPGIQEGAADWDEDWDKLKDEGFTVINELTIEVENVGATPKLNPDPVESDTSSKEEVFPVASSFNADSKVENLSADASSSDIDSKIEKPSVDASSSDADSKIEKPSSPHEQIENESAYAHSEDGTTRSPRSSSGRRDLENSSQDFYSRTFGMHDISPRAKESHSDQHGAESTISGEKSTDEPSWGATFDTSDDVDSVWGFSTLNGKETDHDRSDQNYFFGSGDFGPSPIRTDSPSAASVYGKDKKGAFFDSVPSTPLFNSSSPRFSEGPEDHAFDSFSQFDGGLFPQHDTFSRFDSMRSDKFERFDSIRSTADYNRGFPSFDDVDPFGSGPFKTSESHTPRKGDNWSAF